MSSVNTPTIGPLDPRDASPLPLEPGELVAGRYEVLRLLGSGGSAYVYAVRDRRIGDEIALKLLRDAKRSDLDVERSRREAEFARVSASERLVRTFDLVEAEGHVFLTMELVPGGSVRDLLRRRGPLPIDEVIRLGREIAEALADLHRLDVVHRDLKPGNLLLTAGGHVKLSDFGIARRWTDEQARLTLTGHTLGTVDYLSPEQASGSDVDPRSDLYSFGVVLFEMLTGRVPFEASSAVGAIGMRLTRRADDVRTLRPDTPRWLAALIARLLRKEREERYASAEAVLHDLRRRRVGWRRPPVWRVALLVVLLLGTTWWWSASRGAPRLTADGDRGVRAVDESGETLWTRPDARPHEAALVRRGFVQEMAIITAPSPAAALDPRHTRVLTFLDPRTGRALRTRTLPWPTYSFPEHSTRFGVAEIEALDLDHDGYDEVAITYVHAYYPSFIVLHDLRRDESRLVFVASGHHRIEKTADVDGDGVDELILVGVANRQGWYYGAAAVRVPFERPAQEGTAFTPDRMEVPRVRSLLWYALAPPGTLRARDVTIDAGRRVIRLHYLDRHLDLSFDGFAAPSPLPSAERQALRDRAYEHLRQATRFTSGGLSDAAVEQAEAARLLALRANDATLAEWSARVKGVAMVHARRFDEAAAWFDSIDSDAASDAAFDAGTAFHLAGELPRAVEWYRRSIGRDGHPWVGRMKYEALQGAVLALGEMGRWDEALAEIDRFAAAYPTEAEPAARFRHYVVWRTGGAPSFPYDPDESTDQYRYIALESALARNEDPHALLRAIERDLRIASETRRPLLAARAEALRRAGRLDEALHVAREAYLVLRAHRRASALDRAHLDVAAERLARIAEEKGLVDETRRVRAQADSLRWHPNGMQR